MVAHNDAEFRAALATECALHLWAMVERTQRSLAGEAEALDPQAGSVLSR
ncbi:hypothetical protein ACFL5O_10635 [Myxococcota bacterium]